MLFCSLPFLWFFSAVFVAYWSMPWRQARVYLLLVASFYFYARWNEWLAVLICISTVADFFLARGMDTWTAARGRRLLLTISIVGNLCLLCYFKYANFFLQSLEDALHAMGATASLPVLSVILPVGISFYTFEAINYTVDVYRRQIRAETNLAHFGLFILFFPHLIAGPIVRARDFLPQIGRAKQWSWLRMQVGTQLFLLGLFKKLAIADRMAQFVDPVYADPAAYGTGTTWLAVFAYAFQVYCDFSGYSDMALGTAHMLGYKLVNNFDLPYLAVNITEFWRRWHISLSTWLRDYLFFPLGGSRGSRWLTYRNLLITMALCGLWHGAQWHFVVFGLMQGLLLIGHRLFQEMCRLRPRLAVWLRTSPGLIGCTAFTFFSFTISLVVFRAQSMETAAMVLRRLFVFEPGISSPMHPTGFVLACLLMALGHAAALCGADRWLRQRMPAPVVGAGYAAVLACALLLAIDSNQAFIYFQF